MPFFYISRADTNGDRIPASDYLLPIGPTRVDYPTDALGVLLETSDGNVVQQTPNKDGRRRSWIWVGYRETIVIWPAIWEKLEGLRSRDRIDGGANTPYAYIKETITKKLYIKDYVTGNALGGTSSTLIAIGGWLTNQYTDYNVEIMDGTGVGQVRKVVSNAVDELTITPNWTVTPDGTSIFQIRGKKMDWIRIRVVDVDQKLREDGGEVTYTESHFTFVIDDPNFFVTN